MTSQTPLRIDFVSDVACPWCAIGLASLQQALTRLDGTVNAEIHLQPFEVNPQLPPEGEDANERQMGKYGISEAQLEARRAAIRERAAAFGIAFNTHKGSRVYSTFDAHRLLHWAELQNRQLALALKRILQRAYFSDDENISNHEVLVRLAREAGLDADAARRVLESGEYADTDFEVIAEGKKLESYGPFARQEALNTWRALTGKTVDNAMIRYDLCSATELLSRKG